MRPIAPAVVLALAACSGANPTPTGIKPPPTQTSTFDTLLTGGSIPSGGGSVTVHKSGDPLDGLTLTLSSGAFSGALSVTIGSSTNKNLPTANGIMPISPVVHIASGNGGYAQAAIVLKVPATVPANTYPIIVMYDSATQAMEPMTTVAYDGKSVTALTSHLSNANLMPRPGTGASAMRHQMAGDATPAPVPMTAAVYAIPAEVLNQDWDTGFKPGTNDWEMIPIPTEGSHGFLVDFGAAATALWYFNTRASSQALNGRFPIVKNTWWSDRIGFHWTTLISNTSTDRFVQYATSAGTYATQNGVSDSAQFTQIRASFALAALSTGTPLPIFVLTHDSASSAVGVLIAYKASGNTIQVADPLFPGDGLRRLQLGSGGMIVPYVRSPDLYIRVLPMSLGLALPLSTLASSYQDVTTGTVGNDLFPSSGFYSWVGQLYDTMYVVDSLRIWAQCAQCQYGWATTLSPPPSANIAKSRRIYTIGNSGATDSVGGLSAKGLDFASALTPGTPRMFGLPLISAISANQPTIADGTGDAGFRWLDWHQFTIVKLNTTIAPAAPQVDPNKPLSLSLAVSPAMHPRDVAYQWDFGDNSTKVTVQNDSNVQHTYKDVGTYNVTAKIIDNRNTQVIALATTPVTVGSTPEVWVIQSLTYLYTLKNGVQSSNDTTSNHGYVLFLDSSSVHALVAVDGPPLPSATNYPAGTGFYLAQPADSAQHWANVQGTPLALVSPYSPLDVVSYADSGDKSHGAIVGKAQSSTGGSGVIPLGYSITLQKNGNTLSGYVQFQGSGPNGGQVITEVTVDSVVAQRVQ